MPIPATNMESNIVFFGTGHIARLVLEELVQAGYTPSLVVTAPDTKKGRGMELSPSPVALYTSELSIETRKPENIDADLLAVLRSTNADLYLVADYGHILPQALLDIPKKGVLNMHPSLLPRLRGPSPIRSAILNDEKEIGVSIILLDDKMDHGPLLAQRKIVVPQWPPHGAELDELLARSGGRLLAEIIPLWMRGDIEPQKQNDDIATYCTKFSKEYSKLDLSDDAYTNLLKIRAYEGWPGTYALFAQNSKAIRVKILDADIENDALVIGRVIPEGKREMSYSDFVNSGAKPL